MKTLNKSLFMLLFMALDVPGADCNLQSWRREIENGDLWAYRGYVEPGSARRIYVEIHEKAGMHGSKMVGESTSYINPRGGFEVRVFTAGRLFDHRAYPIFSCE